MKHLLSSFLFLLIFLESFSQSLSQASKIRIGKHNITMQWIGWTKPGIASISQRKDGFYQIDGRQQSDNGEDYLVISGTLQPVKKNSLIFEGTIRSRVSIINGGKECERKGKYHFNAVKNKKYWRLQESKNCEGGMVIDYIDIQF